MLMDELASIAFRSEAFKPSSIAVSLIAVSFNWHEPTDEQRVIASTNNTKDLMA